MVQYHAPTTDWQLFRFVTEQAKNPGVSAGVKTALYAKVQWTFAAG
jgi:hypothetical protein